VGSHGRGQDMSLYVQEEFVDASRCARYGESGVYETGYDTVGTLYRALRREWGRCTGKVYVDQTCPERGAYSQAIGWVFIKRVRYEDSRETYLREVWATVHDRPPVESQTFHYTGV